MQLTAARLGRNDGRARVPEEGERQRALVKMIAFSRTFAGVMVALPHRSGMFPFRVSTPTSAFLDWMFMMVKEHVMCIFNVRVVENFGRIKVRAARSLHLSAPSH